jgi:WD40 repeat protein
MGLSAGTRLGAYEIIGLLGAGGMGEVYRARDTKLDREVAVKVLLPEFSADKERRLRFEQEARAASALNHPGVVHVYDVGASDSTIYIAMELVEGRTLREVLASGPLPTKKILDLALQTADGLARAHDAGIVHRDLKPENLMVSKDNHVRILDFGLAKLTETAGGDLTERATTPQMTHAGMVVGTLGYMSPEQAAGRAVDFRSDQFSFGAMLYEMASGRRAFQRKTGPETLTAILREPPEPLSQVAPHIPLPLRWLIEERCLAKEPEDRYAATRDLLRELRGIRDHISETPAFDLSTGIPVARSRRVALFLGAGVLAALAVGFFAGRRAGGTASPDLPAFQRLTFRRGTVNNARFAPDGRTIVYGARLGGPSPEVFSTRTDSPESRSLGLPPGNLLAVSSTGDLAVSIGGHRVAGWESSGTLARVPLAGGAPREILEDVEEADWAPDGKGLVIVRDVGSRRRLESPIDHVLCQTAGYISSARLSPKGDAIAFLDHPVRGDDAGFAAVVDLAGHKRILSGPYSATGGLQWSPAGDEVWFGGARGGGRVDLRAVTLSGRERLLWRESGDLVLHDIAHDGRVLLSRVNQAREIAGLVPGAVRERSLSWLDWSYPRDLSADGTLLLFDEEGEGAGMSYAVYLRKTDGSPAVRLGEGRAMGLSPDGKWVLGIAEKSLVLMPIGAGMPRTLPLGERTCQEAAWFPDGGRILVSANEPDRPGRLYVLDVSNGGPRPLTPEGVSLYSGNPSSLSPDGKLVAAQGPDRRASFYPIDGGPERPVAGILPEEQVIGWTADSRGVYVHRPSEMPTRVYILDLATGHRVLWRELAPADPAGVEVVRPVLVSRDAKSYVYSYTRRLEDLYLVTGLR